MSNFLRRTWAMAVKETLQLRRDRVTLGMMIVVPLLQLLLFGYAINTNPRHLPTVVLAVEQSDASRAILAALDNSDYFDITRRVMSEAEFDQALSSGAALVGVEIPAGFEKALRRGERPAILLAADATDPIGTSGAIGAAEALTRYALTHLRGLPQAGETLYEVRAHARYNPAGATEVNVVPGLLGTILTMTLMIYTAMSVTRERERGTMEALLAMPIRPLEVMLGKILPYVGIGLIQAVLILAAGIFVFGVPLLGSLLLLTLLSLLFILANLAIGYTFSTVAQNQLQAVQLTFMFFLPNILLSGFMFPFAGMPAWAQWIGEALPLTHYNRIVRGIMLKGSDLAALQLDLLALAAATLVVMVVAVTRFRQTLD